ncbi:hypothetical protein [Peribacillus asahii]|uniref:hypothetical protein n=1 Tax=Peribacillus asahii TaxID=228899 RepID=UPI002079F06A|nr:hypothetical protein [Peribacillus asahii]USK61845.1 hypothetical protein LIT37_11325 [Peribacillus asahii]
MELYYGSDKLMFLLIIILVVFILLNKRKSQKNIQQNNNLINSILSNNTEVVIKNLESRKYGVHSKAKSGESALELAILKDNKYMVAYLIKYGALPNPKELKTAIKCKNEEIIHVVRTGKYQKIILEYKLLKKNS